MFTPLKMLQIHLPSIVLQICCSVLMPTKGATGRILIFLHQMTFLVHFLLMRENTTRMSSCQGMNLKTIPHFLILIISQMINKLLMSMKMIMHKHKIFFVTVVPRTIKTISIRHRTTMGFYDRRQHEKPQGVSYCAWWCWYWVYITCILPIFPGFRHHLESLKEKPEGSNSSIKR